MTEYELAIASNLVDPESIPVSWKDVAGLDSVLQELHDNLILPIQSKKVFPSQLLQPPKGTSHNLNITALHNTFNAFFFFFNYRHPLAWTTRLWEDYGRILEGKFK